MIKIIIFSDIRVYSEGLSRILSIQDAIEVIDSDNSLEDAFPAIEKSLPHMILLDMTMPRSCAFARQVRQLFPEIKIVAIAVPANEQNIIECAEAGISGYVARESSIHELITTILSVDKGEFCCPPQIAAVLFNRIQKMTRKITENFPFQGAITEAASQDLTRRENQILGLMTQGLSNKEIAKALIIQVSTVKNHVHNILVKLEVHSRTQAVALFQNKAYSGNRHPPETERSGRVYY